MNIRLTISMLPTLAAMLLPLDANAQEPNLYSTDFKTSNLADIGFAVDDTNGDSYTWTPTTSSKTFRVMDGESISAIDKYPVAIDNYENDDWLISPLITFEAGKTYKMTFTMAKYSWAAINDAYEVKLGTAKNAGAMTKTLQPLEDGDFPEKGGNSLWTKNLEITVDATGEYCIGFHAVGKPGQKFGIADLKIANGVALVTPAAIDDLKLTPNPEGGKSVTITFTAPGQAKDGTPLDALTKIDILRNDEWVHTINNPALNTPQEYIDNVAVSGLYTYTVRAYTANGGGDPASATTFVGVNTPAAVPSVAVSNTGNRTAHITWEVPSLDKDGYPISPSIITYNVYRQPLYSSDRTEVASGLTELSYDDILPEPAGGETEGEAEADHQFYVYSVAAATAEGTSSLTSALPLPLGQPYQVPYLESFANGRSTTIFTSSAVIGNNYWSLTRDFEDVPSADGDNGMMYLNGQIGGSAVLLSGLVDLGDMLSPTLNYYTYNITGCDPADNTLQVTVTATDGTRKAFDEYIPQMGWNKIILPLDEFVGKTVRFSFTGCRNNNTELHLDAVAVSNIFPHDLKTTGINVPGTVRTSEPFDVIVDVLNAGSQPSGEYTVELFCDEEKVDSYTSSNLGVGAYDHVKFVRVHGIMDNETAVYRASVIYAQDSDNDNNDTESVTATIRKNSYPTVTDLNGTLTDGTASLTWSEPDTEKAQPYETLENFDSYEAGANDGTVGDWILVDRDMATIAGFTEGVMPGIPAFSEQSWWVFDNSWEGFNNGSFATLSGTKFLASMVSGIKGEGTVQNDDWAISPELYGGPQTITVNARSYSLSPDEFETFELLYSTGSTNPDDFIHLQTYENIPAEYKPYTADLPDGAKRFAIRNISEGKMVLMVDDVTYTPVGDPAAFTINGYNIYKDGVKLNEAPVEENEFTDPDAGDGNHTYHVSVLYAAGESRLSNPFNPSQSGVETILRQDGNDNIRYYNLQGISVANPQPGNHYIKQTGRTATKVYIP